MFERQINKEWDFRTANTKEFTHCYHAYPAMMIPQVARSLIEKFAPQGKFELLFDPYMGSGTSLVEASLCGIDSIGTDINPLAQMIARAKVTHFNESQIEDYISELQLLSFVYTPEKVENRDFSRISNYSFWYSDDVLLKLSFLSQFIEQKIDDENRLFFKIPLSELVREVSFTRNGEFKRFRMPENKIEIFRPDVFRLFEEKVMRNLNGLRSYNAILHRSKSTICNFNSVFGIPEAILQPNSVDMVVTSPPYGDSRTTVAYGQFSRWANEWFGLLDGQNLDNLLMGGKRQSVKIFDAQTISEALSKIESEDIKRYLDVVAFLNDYYKSIKNVAQVVRSGGRVCYVVGNRNVKGVQIPLDYFTAEIFEQCGFKFETTIVREIPNKRMPSKTSPSNQPGQKVNTMANEYIVVLTKQ